MSKRPPRVSASAPLNKMYNMLFFSVTHPLPFRPSLCRLHRILRQNMPTKALRQLTLVLSRNRTVRVRLMCPTVIRNHPPTSGVLSFSARLSAHPNITSPSFPMLVPSRQGTHMTLEGADIVHPRPRIHVTALFTDLSTSRSLVETTGSRLLCTHM